MLAQQIREVYAPLFGASLEPFKEANEALKNLFNIHSGGAEITMEFQIGTFKALCEHADFSGATPPAANNSGTGVSIPKRTTTTGAGNSADVVPLSVNINLHIHLPEGKSSRDYQYIIQDIAKYIYRHTDAGDDRET